MTKVRCTVESCEFWGRGDYCTADEIQVNNNFAADEDDDLFYLTGFEVAEEPEAEPERERAVSYTHLDVYKRQGISWPVRSLSRRLKISASAWPTWPPCSTLPALSLIHI